MSALEHFALTHCNTTNRTSNKVATTEKWWAGSEEVTNQEPRNYTGIVKLVEECSCGIAYLREDRSCGTIAIKLLEDSSSLHLIKLVPTYVHSIRKPCCVQPSLSPINKDQRRCDSDLRMEAVPDGIVVNLHSTSFSTGLVGPWYLSVPGFGK